MGMHLITILPQVTPSQISYLKSTCDRKIMLHCEN